MNTDALTNEQINQKLKTIDLAWSVVGGSMLERVFEFSDYASGLTFLNKIAALAETANHHPSMHLSWGKLVVTMNTHDGGSVLTNKDFTLAKEIDSLHGN